MDFVLLEDATKRFTAMVNDALGRDAVERVTLEVPQPPPDELHFNRLVVWCYGFFYEAAADVLKECKALLRQGPPERTNRFDQGLKVVNHLRTYKVHNLPPSKENDGKRRQAEAWIADASGSNKGIAGANQALCEIAIEMINALIDAWQDATRDHEDAAQLVTRVLGTIEKTWQPHELDTIVSSVASEINLSGFDAKAFRECHLDEWRRFAGCFLDRDNAAAGLRRLIRSSMRSRFGKS